MNHRGGVALIQATWLSWLQHRGFFFVLAFGWMVPPLIYLFVWSTAAGQGEIGGMSRGAFVAYYLTLILVNQLTYSQTNWTVGDVIREGKINLSLLRPIPYLYEALSSEAAGKVVYLAFIVPVSAVLAVILRPELYASAGGAALFFPALFFAWALRFFWGYALALLAFWSTRADALLAVQDSLVFLLAGVVAPVALLPGALQPVSVALPFRYMVGFPVEVLTRHLSGAELLLGFGIQLGWLALALLAARLAWKLGLRHYSAVGG